MIFASTHHETHNWSIPQKSINGPTIERQPSVPTTVVLCNVQYHKVIKKIFTLQSNLPHLMKTSLKQFQQQQGNYVATSLIYERNWL